MKKKQLFRQYHICEIEARNYKHDAHYNRDLIAQVVRKNNLLQEYDNWKKVHGDIYHRRTSPFPTEEVVNFET